MYKAVGRKKLQYFELLTLLSDIQNSINSRPLTYLNDNFDSITPNSFLKIETGGNVLLDGLAGSELQVPNRASLTRALEKRAELFDAFHQQWVDLYLLSLRETSRDLFQEEWHNRIAEGDIVLVSSPNKPRHLWQMGKVTELLPGKDNVVRTVRVMRPGQSEGIYSINLLYPLELSVTPTNKLNRSTETKDSETTVRPPKRRAAEMCLEKLKSSN